MRFISVVVLVFVATLTTEALPFTADEKIQYETNPNCTKRELEMKSLERELEAVKKITDAMVIIPYYEDIKTDYERIGQQANLEVIDYLLGKYKSIKKWLSSC